MAIAAASATAPERMQLARNVREAIATLDFPTGGANYRAKAAPRAGNIQPLVAFVYIDPSAGSLILQDGVRR
jgi:hypothetical protein